MDAVAARPERDGTRSRGWGRLLLRVSILVLAFVAMVGFSVVLAKVTLTPSPASEELVKSNLHPGRSLRQYAEDYTFLAACKQAGGNLVLGMPFGILLPILVPRKLRMLRMFVLTVLVIVLVELVQGAIVRGRAFDVDDVILNTAGALLAYLLVGRRLSHRYHVLAEEPARAPAAREARRPKNGRPKTGTRRNAQPGKKAAPARKSEPRTKAVPREKTGARATPRRTAAPASAWSRLRHGVRRKKAARGRSTKR
ncbi:VanZ family protein [Streptomyces sp. NPDC058369]|uniref:VanZ family protein n=1 Tax=unclassified Streptomyces TaxID=2593676 RepID=UPI00225399B3|nr:VanZ family protein [Streptomyces sp. NBC_01789]MCX4450980.1 VanZ family protein [Streptomyces sp. NBC_01789]